MIVTSFIESDMEAVATEYRKVQESVKIDEEKLASLYAGLLRLVTLAFRQPLSSLKADVSYVTSGYITLYLGIL